jgi:hypothetical protein
MTPFDRVREAFYNHTEDGINSKDLYLAWFAFCHDRPAFHPDDARDPECGVSGWHMLLVEMVRSKQPLDEVLYPASIMRMPWAIKQFQEFHSSDEDWHFKNILDMLETFFSPGEYDVKDLKAVLDGLTELINFHDGAPEDEFSVLSSTYDALFWVNI